MSDRAPMTLDAARVLVARNMPGLFSRRNRRSMDYFARILQTLDIAEVCGGLQLHADLLRVWRTPEWQSSDPAALALLTSAAVDRPGALSAAELAALECLRAGGAV